MLSLRDAVRFFMGGNAKKKPLFETEKQAYDFCREVHKKNGGATDELRKSFEFYQKHMNNNCDEFTRPFELQDIANPRQGAT